MAQQDPDSPFFLRASTPNIPSSSDICTNSPRLQYVTLKGQASKSTMFSCTSSPLNSKRKLSGLPIELQELEVKRIKKEITNLLNTIPEGTNSAFVEELQKITNKFMERPNKG